MALNWVERGLINSPVRAWIQRHYEARVLEALGGRLDGQRVLEIGCGRGVGAEILLDKLGAGRIVAFDLDASMVRPARQRLLARSVDLAAADATAIPFIDRAFDAVVDFGILHHVQDWRPAVAEVSRVLRGGGRFYFEEVTKRALDRWAYRTLFDHPTIDRFSTDEFVAELGSNGITVDRTIHRFFGDFVIGVGVKRCSIS